MAGGCVERDLGVILAVVKPAGVFSLLGIHCPCCRSLVVLALRGNGPVQEVVGTNWVFYWRTKEKMEENILNRFETFEMSTL